MSRSTQSKAQNEANARILRALVKHPDNKVCADCKRNDPRWASWNIGCFLCIRCSGIHRSMGTHISKVKSIDLDIWTPEQMESIQKWGNKLCNLYWEAHLKAGHVPAEHKIESFIRSKYDSRRWAKEGPPPQDPSTLDRSAGAAPAETAPAPAPAAAPASSRSAPAAAAPRSNPLDLLSDPSPSPAAPPVTSGGSNLLDDAPPVPAAKAAATASASSNTAQPAPPKPSGGGGGGLFDLDWHEPAPASATSPASPTSGGAVGGARGKNDIMSLFAAKPATSPVVQQPAASSGFGDFGSFASPTAPTGNASSGLGGLNSSFGGLDLSSNKPAAAAGSGFGSATTGGSNPWAQANAAPASSGGGGLFDTQGVWGSNGSGSQASSTTKPPPKDDAFADIWGDFK